MNKIISIFKQKHPEYKDWSDDLLWKNLKQPDKFKKAFPEYKDWDDNKILKNLSKYDKSIMYVDTNVNKKIPQPAIEQPPKTAPVLNITRSLTPKVNNSINNKTPKTIKVPPIVASDKGAFNVTTNTKKRISPEALKYFLRFGKMPAKKDLTAEAKLKQTSEELEKSTAGAAARTVIRAANSYTGGMMNKVLNKEQPSYIQKHLQPRSKTENAVGVAADFAGALLPGSVFSGISKGAGAVLGKLGLTKKLAETAVGKILPGQIGKKITPHVSRILYNAVHSGVSGIEYGALQGAVEKSINKDYSIKKLLNDIGTEAKNWAIMGTVLGEAGHWGTKALGKGLSKLKTKNIEKAKINEAKKILGVNNADNIDSIAKKYKQLAKKYHPDKGGSAEDMAKINTAYELLKQHYVKNYTKNIFGKLSDYLKKNFGIKTDIKNPPDAKSKGRLFLPKKNVNIKPTKPGIPEPVSSKIKNISKSITTIPEIKTPNIEAKSITEVENTRSLSHTDAGTPLHPVSSAVPSAGQDINNIPQSQQNVKKNLKLVDTSNIDTRLAEIENEMYKMDKVPANKWTDEMKKRLNKLIDEGSELTNKKEKIIEKFKKNSNNVEKFLYNNNIKEEGINKPSKLLFDNKKISEMTDDEVSSLFQKYDFLSPEDIEDNAILMRNGRSKKHILKRLEKMYKPSGISSKTHNVFNHVAKSDILSKDIQTGNKKKIFIYGDLGNFTTMNAIFGHTGTDRFKEATYKGIANIVNEYDPEGKFGQDTNGDEHWISVDLTPEETAKMLNKIERFADRLAEKKYKINRDALKEFIKGVNGEYKERLQKIYDSGATEITLKDLPYKGGGTRSFTTKEGFVEYNPVDIRNRGEDVEEAINRITKEADYKIGNKNAVKGGEENGTGQIQTLGSQERRGTGAQGDAGVTQRISGAGIQQEGPSVVSPAGEYPGNKSENQIPARAPGKSPLVENLPGKNKSSVPEKNLFNNNLGIVSPGSQFIFELEKVLKDFNNEWKNELKENLNLENIKEKKNIVKNKFGKVLERYYGLDRDLQRVFIKYEEGAEKLYRRLLDSVISHYGKYSKDIREYASLYLENPKKYLAENSKNPKAVKEVAMITKKFQDWALNKLKDIDVFGKEFKSYFDSKIKALEKEKIQINNEIKKAKNNNSNTLINKLYKEYENINAEIAKLRDLNYIHHYVKNPKLSKKIFIWLKGGLIKRLRITPRELKGRKFNTIDDLKDAGFEVETDSAVIAARILRITAESMRNKELINSLKKHKDFILPKAEAKNNPGTIDWTPLPEIEGLSGYLVNPIIADAIKEVVWTPNYDTPWKKYISKPMRKLNIALKLARFYKPFIMAYNDLQQAWMATPFKSVFTFPKSFISAVRDVNKKTPLYDAIEERGGYNKDYTFYKKLIEEEVKNILEKKEKGITYMQIRRIIKDMNPVNLIKDIYKITNNVTWTLDEIIRTAVVKELMSTGMSLNEAVDKMNMHMGWYNYMPKSTKHALNTWAFVGNYRISMLRMYKNIFKSSIKGTTSLVKNSIKGNLKKGAKDFKTNWWAQRSAVKWLIWKLAVSKYLYMLGFAGAMMGYRYMKKTKNGPIKTVSMGGPVYEIPKALSRPLSTTLKYNLAALPGLAMALLYNKGWHGKQIYNPYADSKTQQLQIGSYILENFFPWTTEIKDLTGKGKSTMDKLLNFLGLAYTYNIKNLTPEQLSQLINETQMRNDLSPQEKAKEIRKLIRKFHSQRKKYHKKQLEVEEMKKQ